MCTHRRFAASTENGTQDIVFPPYSGQNVEGRLFVRVSDKLLISSSIRLRPRGRTVPIIVHPEESSPAVLPFDPLESTISAIGDFPSARGRNRTSRCRSRLR